MVINNKDGAKRFVNFVIARPILYFSGLSGLKANLIKYFQTLKANCQNGEEV